MNTYHTRLMNDSGPFPNSLIFVKIKVLQKISFGTNLKFHTSLSIQFLGLKSEFFEVLIADDVLRLELCKSKTTSHTHFIR